MAVAIVIDEGAAGVPTLQAGSGSRSHSRFDGYIGEGAIAVIAPERAIAPITDKEIFVAIVVIVAGADALAPAGLAPTPALAVTSVKVPSRLFL